MPPHTDAPRIDQRLLLQRADGRPRLNGTVEQSEMAPVP
jgi:hypothetical protein